MERLYVSPRLPKDKQHREATKDNAEREEISSRILHLSAQPDASGYATNAIYV
jgi:hypothetical protein